MKKLICIIALAALILQPAIGYAGSAWTGRTSTEHWSKENNDLYETAGNVGVGVKPSDVDNDRLSVEGTVTLREGAAPGTNKANYGKLYVKSADSKIYFRTDAGVEYNLTAAAASGAPTDATYVVMSHNASLLDDRLLTAGSGITVTDSGVPAGAVTISVGADQIKDTMIDWGTGAGQVSTTDVTEGTNEYFTSGKVQTVGDARYLKSTDTPLTVPTQVGHPGQVLGTNGTTLSWVSPTSGGDHSVLSNLAYASAGHTGFEPTVTKGNLTETTSSILTIGGGTGAVIGSGTTITVTTASSGVSGYLTGGDWNTFNGKESALTFSTGLARATNTITNTLATGLAGSQVVYGGTAASENLSLQSTTDATRGTIFAIDDLACNKRLAIQQVGGTNYKYNVFQGGAMTDNKLYTLPTIFPGDITGEANAAGTGVQTLVLNPVAHFPINDNTVTVKGLTIQKTIGGAKTVCNFVANGSLTLKAVVASTGLDYGAGTGTYVLVTGVISLDAGAADKITGDTTSTVDYRYDCTGLMKSTDDGIMSWDLNAYLTSESDTLGTVTGRGASTTTAVLFQNATAVELGKDISGGTPNIAGAMKLWSAGDNAYYTTITNSTQTQAAIAYTMPTDDGGTNQFLQTDGSGTLTWATALTAEADTLQDVTTRGATTTTATIFQNAAAIELGKDDATNVAGSMKMWGAGANNFYTTITAATQSANATYTLPTAMPGTNDYPLICSTAGVLSWNDQAVKQASTPQFARLGLGQAADAGAVMAATGQYFSAKKTDTVATGAWTSNWNEGNVHYVVLDNGAHTATFSNPKDGARYLLIVKQPASGAAGTVTWPADVEWPGNTPPTLTATNGQIDILTFVYDGTNTNYYGGASLNYEP